MEDVYTIKVKTKPDTRNLYPSERRYSASTVAGLAWVHIALAATSFLLTCLALANPNAELQTNHDDTANRSLYANGNEIVNSLIGNENDSSVFENDSTLINSNDSNYEQSNLNKTTVINGAKNDSNYFLVLAPALIAIFGLAAGLASILASVKWYIDHNITWLFIVSCLSTIVSFTSFIMIAVWFITSTGADITDFYKDKVPFKDFLVVKHTDVLIRNNSHMVIVMNHGNLSGHTSPNMFSNKVLSINILIAAFLEFLWSILSVKISYKGMKNTYKEETERRGNCISVVTKIKGNDTRKFPRNSKIAPPKPDLIEHYPSKKIKRIFLAQSDNGYYLKNQVNKAKPNTETSSEFYKERMMNFLNRCASLEGVSNPEISPSIHSESLNPIPEGISVERTAPEPPAQDIKDSATSVSWGDSPEHTIYNQNTLNLEKIFKLKQNVAKKSENDEK